MATTTASPPPHLDLQTFIHCLPKAELHLHIEGTLSLSLAARLAARNSITLPSSPSTADTIHDLPSFLAVYYPRMAVLLHAPDFHDLLLSYLRAAAAQSVRHIECFFDPQAHTSRGVLLSTVMAGLVSAIRVARAESSIDASLILCFLRDRPVAEAETTLDAALALPEELREVIVGVGLDSDERGNPPGKFRDVFRRARQRMPGWKVTVHCDVDQEGSIGNIRQCLEELRVDRIDHGSNLLEDEGLVETVRTRGLGLTCCPASNGFVCGDWKEGDIGRLVEMGVRVTLNTDDPAYFGKDLCGNYEMFARGLVKRGREEAEVRREVVRVARNAFEVAWVEEEKKRAWIEELEAFGEANGMS